MKQIHWLARRPLSPIPENSHVAFLLLTCGSAE